jgi:hypothetical protein
VKQEFDIPKTERKYEVQPDSTLDNRSRIAMVFEQGFRDLHRNIMPHACWRVYNLTMPESAQQLCETMESIAEK